MTTRDDDVTTAGTADNSDTVKTINSLDANRSSNNQSSSSTTSTNNNNNANGSSTTTMTTTMTTTTTHTKNWFRLIPRRIRKFITKNHHRQVNNETNAPNDSVVSVATTSDAVYANQTFVGDGDGADESNLYSMVDYMGNDEEVAMIRACSQMARYGWFWGPISRHTAQQRLHATPNGSFLVRNSQINLHNFTISFRTAGKTLHYRIEFVDGFWQTFNSKHRSIVDLIDDAMKKSKENVFCYVKQNSQLLPPFPVRLTNPISHFGDISSLQNMCRMVIQKNIDIGKMDLLPLPTKLISYCKEWETIYGEMPIRIG